MRKLFRNPHEPRLFSPSETSASAAPTPLRKITFPAQTQNLPLFALKPRWNLQSAFAQPDATFAQSRKSQSLNKTKKVMRIIEACKAIPIVRQACR